VGSRPAELPARSQGHRRARRLIPAAIERRQGLARERDDVHSDRLAGGCQCGAIRYEIVAAPVSLYVCHCRECQKQSASAFGISVIVKRSDFRLLRGDLRNASLAMGRNAAYIHPYLYRGSPKVLSEDDRVALAEHLGVDEDDLRHQARPRPQVRPTLRAPRVASAADGGPLEGFSKIAEIDVRASAGPGRYSTGSRRPKMCGTSRMP
jgi:hypothetical protein